MVSLQTIDEIKVLFKNQFEELLKQHQVKDMVVFPKLDDEGNMTLENERYNVFKDNLEPVKEIDGFLKAAKNVLSDKEILGVFAKYKSL